VTGNSKIMLFENYEKQERLGILQTEAQRIYLGFCIPH
jgi:hypothetical protein